MERDSLQAALLEPVFYTQTPSDQQRKDDEDDVRSWRKQLGDSRVGEAGRRRSGGVDAHDAVSNGKNAHAQGLGLADGDQALV